MWNLKKKDTNVLIYKAEIELQMWKTNLWSPRGKERRGINWEIGTNIHTLCWERLRAGGEDGKRRWLDSIIDSTHMSLSKLRETVKDRKPGMLQSTQLQRIRHN